MEKLQVSPTTVQFNSPSWNGNGFSEGEPNSLWQRLPENLRNIAIAEIESGNRALAILDNSERRIVRCAASNAARAPWISRVRT
jgi:hypothetical protein